MRNVLRTDDVFSKLVTFMLPRHSGRNKMLRLTFDLRKDLYLEEEDIKPEIMDRHNEICEGLDEYEMPSWPTEEFDVRRIEVVAIRPMNYTQVYCGLREFGPGLRETVVYTKVADHDSCWNDGADRGIKIAEEQIDLFLLHYYKKVTGREDFDPRKLSTHFRLEDIEMLEADMTLVEKSGHSSDYGSKYVLENMDVTQKCGF